MSRLSTLLNLVDGLQVEGSVFSRANRGIISSYFYENLEDRHTYFSHLLVARKLYKTAALTSLNS